MPRKSRAEGQVACKSQKLYTGTDLTPSPVRNYISLPARQKLLTECVDGSTPNLQAALLKDAPLMGNFKNQDDVSILLSFFFWNSHGIDNWG